MTALESIQRNYLKPWSYSGAEQDAQAAIAIRLTDEDRAAGRYAPDHGCTAENYKRAADMIHDARHAAGLWCSRTRCKMPTALALPMKP